jgi:hypothetical protein
MATANTDRYKLSQVDEGGIIHEDVMNKIWNIDPVDLPYQDAVGTGEAFTDFYKSWVKENLAAPDLTNKRVDGNDAGAAAVFDEARIGNHIQLSDKVVRVSDGARAVEAIGYADRLMHELMVRQKELKRDMEAILVSNQASIEMTSSVAGQTAGIGAMFETNIINGTAGGFSGGIFSAPTPGAAAGVTEAMLRDAAEMAYTEGGNPSILMSTPKVIRGISEYMFSASARIATMTSEVSTKTGKYGHQGVTAIGAVNTFVSDFDTLVFVPNRTQQTYVNVVACANVYLLDPEYWSVGYLQGIETSSLARTGTAENRQMTTYYGNIAMQEKSSAVIMGVDPTVAVTAG